MIEAVTLEDHDRLVPRRPVASRRLGWLLIRVQAEVFRHFVAAAAERAYVR